MEADDESVPDRPGADGRRMGYFPILSFPDRTACEQAKERVIATDPAKGHAIRYHAMCVQPTVATGV
ncbi:MAG: hypothetical protein OXH64_07790 [Rhodospirillaceae bacterium]|nr:hypothetical protein [Rhodospirillaceae bacterium]